MANPVLAQSHTAPDKPRANASTESPGERVRTGFIAESLARHQIAGVTVIDTGG
jgi:hypothetical protein